MGYVIIASAWLVGMAGFGLAAVGLHGGFSRRGW